MGESAAGYVASYGQFSAWFLGERYVPTRFKQFSSLIPSESL